MAYKKKTLAGRIFCNMPDFSLPRDDLSKGKIVEHPPGAEDRTGCQLPGSRVHGQRETQNRKTTMVTTLI